MKKIQLIVTSGRLHEYNFMKFILPNDSIDVYSDTGPSKASNEEINEYYNTHDINVINAKKFDKCRIRIIRILFNLISGIIKVVKSRKINYDYCFISFLSTRRAILSFFLPKKRKTILIAHGSDILRKSNFNEFFFKKMLDRSYKIVFNSYNVQNRFEQAYGKKYSEKCIYIPFPSSSFERLEDSIKGLDKKTALKSFNLPENRIIVVCGHTSTFEEQFEKLIPQLEKVDSLCLKKCHFVFPMTYGNADYIKYREQIIDLLSTTKLSYTVIKDYCSVDKMAALHLCSDVHINCILTDALSIFMQEELYLGCRLLYGEWLDYPELRMNSINYNTFKHFDEIPSILTKIILESDFSIPSNEKNTIKKLKCIDDIKEAWRNVINE